MTADEFENLVTEAVENLPDEILSYLRNVAIVVEMWPSQAQLQRTQVGPGYTLFGLYEGIPLTQRGSNYNLVLPDRITIFQGPIQQAFHTAEAVREQVRKTVIHELAHHFGFDEDGVRRLGY